jgi:drug/metabolite transporter (DMT)-like permease
MTLRVLLLTVLSVSISGVAQVALKSGVSSPAVKSAMATQHLHAIVQAFVNPGVVGGLFLYGVGAMMWLGVLSRADLSLAYPFVSLSFIITSAAGWLLFHEAVTPGRLAGLALVLAGVVLCGRG